MNSSRLWTLGSVVVIIALVAGTWFVAISPRLAEAATANTERQGVELLNANHSATLAALKEQFDDLPALKAELDEIRLAVPSTDDTASLLRQLSSLAAAAGVSLEEVTLSSPEWFVPPAETPADSDLATALGSVSSENFLTIAVEQTVTGEYAAVMAYLNSIQMGQRTFLVHAASIPGITAGDTHVEVSVSGQVFVLLDREAAVPVDGSAAPAEGGQVPQ